MRKVRDLGRGIGYSSLPTFKRTYLENCGDLFMSDTLTKFAEVLLHPGIRASTKRDFLLVLGVGIKQEPALANKYLTDLVVEAGKDRWWGVRESAMWGLFTIVAVRPELVTPKIVDYVLDASKLSFPATTDIGGGRLPEDIAKLAKRVLDMIAKSRPDLLPISEPMTPVTSVTISAPCAPDPV